HAEFAQNERPFLGQILQSQQVFLKVALVVQVNVKAEKIDILRQKIFSRRISGVGKENIRIDRASDLNQFLHKIGDATHTEPAHHRARDLISDEVTENRRMTGMRADRS